MTAVGKILVFFNLIFSLIVGAFVVTVYISQTHWAAEYNDLKKRYEVADASNAAYQQELKKASDYAKVFNDQVLRDGDLEKAAGLKDSDDQPTKLKKIKDVIKAALTDAVTQKGLADKAREDFERRHAEADGRRRGFGCQGRRGGKTPGRVQNDSGTAGARNRQKSQGGSRVGQSPR